MYENAQSINGSSPHTRGARSYRRCCTGCGRIIPAYAGSTHPTPVSPRRRRDHPRIRGEHRGWPWGWFRTLGSSPHTRGAHGGLLRGSPVPGIIPAYAGSTTGSVGFVTSHWDHPRIRGEHEGRGEDSDDRGGSSPHTRGARVGGDVLHDTYRIIPAYAGSTSKNKAPIARGKDHPRIRGEHGPRKEATAVPEGSSPHTRGARR